MPTLNEVKVKVTTEADNKGLKDAEAGVSGFGSSLGRIGEIVAGLGLAKLAGDFLNIGKAAFQMGLDSASNLETSKIALTTLLGDTQKANDLISKIQTQAKITPFDQQGLIDMNQLLIGSGMEAEKANKTVLQLGDALAATGKGTPELKRIGNTMSQVFGKGKADAVDFKEMVNAGWVTAKKDVADTLGVTMPMLEQMITDGKIGFTQLSETLTKVTGDGGKYFKAMENQSGSFSGKMSNLMDSLNIGLGDLFTKTGAFDAIKKGLDILINALNAGFPLILNFVNGIKSGFTDMGGVFATFKPYIDTFLAAWQFVSSFFMGTIVPIFTQIFDIVGAVINSFNGFGSIKNSLVELWTAVQPIFQALAVFIGVVLVGLLGLFTGFMAGLAAALPGILAFFDGLVNFVTGVINVLVGIFTGHWDLVLKGFTQMGEGILKIIVGAFTAILGFISGFVFGVIKFFTDLYDKLVGHSIVPDMVNAITMWIQKMKDMVMNILNAFKGAWEGVWNAVSTVVMNIWNGIYNFIKGKVNDLVNIINGLIKGFNGVSSKISGGSVSIPEIPHFAEGVTNFSGGMALVGERGPELVTLPRGSNVIPNNEIGKNVTVNQTNNIYSGIDVDVALHNLITQLRAA